MKSLVVEKGGALSVRDLPMPKIGEHQALVKMLSCGVCAGTDMKIVHGQFKNFGTYPCTLGHEAVGRVIETGAKVKKFKIGDRVMLPYVEETLDGVFPGWGGFSEYAVVGDFEAAALCGLGCETPGFNEGYYAQTIVPDYVSDTDAVMIVTFREVLSAIKRFGFKENETVVIYGCGPVGLCFIKFASLLGAGKIIALDIVEDKLADAARLGADHVLLSGAGSTEKVRELCPGGADHVVDAVGINSLINEAMKLVKYNGQICVYGIAPQLGMELDWSQAPYNWNVHFVQWPSKYEEYLMDNTVLNWIKTGVLVPSDFISDILPFDRILEGFEKTENKQVAKKMVITFD
ncbi:MAG: zinc-binding dehydrogenase [Oscillospiraceae bacterium]|nr:zinc-binding dehydrogenase [Oscillospiraceae bacterium]